MSLAVRWGLAVVSSVAAFAVSWWVCQAQLDLAKDTALAVAAAVLAVVLAVAGWWAAREQRSGGGPGSDAGPRVRQTVRAGRDAYTAGRDLTVNNNRRPGE